MQVLFKGLARLPVAAAREIGDRPPGTGRRRAAELDVFTPHGATRFTYPYPPSSPRHRFSRRWMWIHLRLA